MRPASNQVDYRRSDEQGYQVLNSVAHSGLRKLCVSMPDLTTHWLAAAAFGCYLALVLWNAQVGRRESKALADYYVGGRQMGGLALGVSYFATFASTNSYIGNAGKGYAYGLPWLTLAALMVLFTGLSWRFVHQECGAYRRHRCPDGT